LSILCISLFFTNFKEKGWIIIFTISDTTGKRYEPESCVFFKNAKQSASYVLWGATLLDVFPTSDKIFVFVFSKEDHDRYRKKWNNYGE